MIQKALLTPLAGCGAQHESHGVVDNITVLRRLRPTHLVLLVDDSETMGYVLTGRLVTLLHLCMKMWHRQLVLLAGEAFHILSSLVDAGFPLAFDMSRAFFVVRLT